MINQFRSVIHGALKYLLASVSSRSIGEDPTTFESWSGPNIGGPAHPTSN